MGRQSEPGPKPGTYIITVEIPPDSAGRDAVFAAVRNIAGMLIPESWVTMHRVMENRGKHGTSGTTVEQ
jgi:hypothetical protein